MSTHVPGPSGADDASTPARDARERPRSEPPTVAPPDGSGSDSAACQQSAAADPAPSDSVPGDRAPGDPAPGEDTASAARPDDADRPATYGEVFAVREYRAVFAAGTLSWIGDYFTRVAVTYLIFQDTGSVLLSAAAFAISYLPWIAGGPVLAALAERYPYRSVMVVCDLLRMALVAVLAIPAVPLPVLLVLLFLASLMTPPAQAARSAMLPLILTGDRYVVGLSVQAVTAQAAQVAGYAAGGVFAAAVSPRAALLVDAATFALSALLVWRGVRPRPPAMTDVHRSHLLRETREGFRVVFGHPVMRPIAFLVFSSVSVVIVPEGLAAAWSAQFGDHAGRTGLLMASVPLGYVTGAVLIGRMSAPSTRLKLIRPLAVLTPLALLPALLDPPFAVVVVIGFLAGFGNAVLMPLNGLFVQVLPNAYRARAFGIMQGGMQMLHAAAVLTTGLLAERFSVPVVVGGWALAGLVLIGVASTRWPNREVIDAEIERARRLNQPKPGTARPDGTARSDGTAGPAERADIPHDETEPARL